MKKFILSSLIIMGLVSNSIAEEKKELIFYIGITMVKPINELVQKFKETCECDIKILQGGSQDLYDSLKTSQKGDLYMPGSLSYRKNNLKDGILLDSVFVGYNKLAMVVQKGNPKNIPNTLDVFTNENYKSALGNAESGSVGDETKNVLTKYGNYEDAILNTLYLSPDSRFLTKSIINKEVDVTLNWYATTFWEDNKEGETALIIDEKYASKKLLILNLTKFSKYPELTKEFMKLATSEYGKKVFFKYGFLDENDLENYSSIKYE